MEYKVAVYKSAMNSLEFKDLSCVAVSLTVSQAKKVLLQQTLYTDRWDARPDGYSSVNENCKSEGYQ